MGLAKHHQLGTTICLDSSTFFTLGLGDAPGPTLHVDSAFAEAGHHSGHFLAIMTLENEKSGRFSLLDARAGSATTALRLIRHQ